jgi:hypothetical protein
MYSFNVSISIFKLPENGKLIMLGKYNMSMILTSSTDMPKTPEYNSKRKCSFPHLIYKNTVYKTHLN